MKTIIQMNDELFAERSNTQSAVWYIHKKKNLETTSIIDVVYYKEEYPTALDLRKTLDKKIEFTKMIEQYQRFCEEKDLEKNA